MSKLDYFKQTINEVLPLSRNCWEALEVKLYPKMVEKEDWFSKAHTKIREVGFITSGLMREYYVDENGQEWNKCFSYKGDFLMPTLDPMTEAKVDIQALQDTKLLAIQYMDYLSLSQKYPELNTLTQKLTAHYLNLKQERLVHLLSKSAKERYLHFLDLYAAVKDQIPQYHISSYLGVTPTQLSRLRKEMALNQHL